MNKTMQILTSTSVLRVCLIATLLLVNPIPRSVQAKEGPGNIWGVNAKNQIFTLDRRWLATGSGRAEVCIGQLRWCRLGRQQQG